MEAGADSGVGAGAVAAGVAAKVALIVATGVGVDDAAQAVNMRARPVPIMNFAIFNMLLSSTFLVFAFPAVQGEIERRLNFFMGIA